MLINYVSIIPKAISCSWTTIKISIFQFQLITTQYQNKAAQKYLGVILDDELNWKPQVEKLVIQLSKSCGMLFKWKHYTNISLLKSVYFAVFHSHLTYSGYTFSHSDLPFPARCCIPYVRSGLCQLVIRVKGFRVCALHCDLAITSITHCIIRFCPPAWTPRFQRVELCIASARTTLAVSAVAPS